MRLLYPPVAYIDLDAFYDDEPAERRRLSPEVDFGVRWALGDAPVWGPHRVSLVTNTGELYRVRLADPQGPERGEPRVRVLAVFEDREEAEWALDGWASSCGPGGLRWLNDRLQACVPHYVCPWCFAYRRQPPYTPSTPRTAAPVADAAANGLSTQSTSATTPPPRSRRGARRSASSTTGSSSEPRRRDRDRAEDQA